MVLSRKATCCAELEIFLDNLLVDRSAGLHTIFSSLDRYDLEAIYFEEDVRNAKRQYLESKALQARQTLLYFFILDDEMQVCGYM